MELLLFLNVKSKNAVKLARETQFLAKLESWLQRLNTPLLATCPSWQNLGVDDDLKKHNITQVLIPIAFLVLCKVNLKRNVKQAEWLSAEAFRIFLSASYW